MQRILAGLLAFSLIAGSSPTFAAGADDRPLARAAMTEANRLVAVGASQAPQPPAAPQRSWGGRHPVLFGALVGGGGGAAVVALTASPCDRNQFCPGGYGAAIAAVAMLGAGIGSIAGFIIGEARK
jgi:hypothetical protein